MISFAARRVRMLAVAALIALGLAGALHVLSLGLRRDTLLSGWILLGLFLFLAAYNLRKKLPFLPLGASSTWLQAHLYGGLLAVAVFGLHAGFRAPGGPLETILMVLFAGVTLTGLLGIVLSRLLPMRLTARGPEVLFDRIPALRRKLREDAEALVLQSVASDRGSMPLADFYVRRLAKFFERPRNIVPHLLEIRRPCEALLHRLKELERYLDEEECLIARALAGLVRAKDGLDYQLALQGALKGWLFVHIPLTWALLVFSVPHAVVAYAFSGAVR